MLSYVTSENQSFYWTDIKFKIGTENKGWISAVENNRTIFDDLELQLIVRVKVKKMLCENLDDSW